MRADACIAFLCVFLLTGVRAGEKNESVFVPTREWQTVKKGTPIPEGLHVRHNFQTGVTEAKLMDPEETEKKDSEGGSTRSHSKSLTLHPDKNTLQSEDTDSLKVKESDPFKSPIAELKARLRKLKQDGTSDSASTESHENVKKKFRSYEALKKELKALEVNVTSDSELLKTFFQKFQPYKNGITTGTLTLLEIEEVLEILNNLEYLIHQIDNAQLFADMEGMTKIISPCLNGTNNEIKAEALRLLGAAVQSNPKVQAKALESDFIQKLLHMLSTNGKTEVKSRCLFALSALIRQFPAAQKTWIDHGGLEIFGKILIDDQLQVQMKVMRLINDLIVERQNLQEETENQQLLQRKTREYALTDFEQKLLMHKYCKHLSNLMIKIFSQELMNDFSIENSDVLETVSRSMITVSPLCKSEFQQDRNLLLPVVNNILNFYRSIDSVNTIIDEDDVLKNLVSQIEELRTTISDTSHDEL